MASITIKDMSVSYNKGKSYVLDKLNLEIKDGEFCVFLGPSGCGKSTAMHCIAGLLHPMNGEIRFGDAVMTAAGGKGKDKTFGSATGAEHCNGVSGVCPVPQHDRAGKYVLRPENQEGSQGGN